MKLEFLKFYLKVTKKSCQFWTTFKHLFLIKNCRLPEGAARGSSPLPPCCATVHKLFSVVDVSGPQVFQAVRRMSQSKIIWLADCSSAPQMHLGVSNKNLWYKRVPKRPTPVLNLFRAKFTSNEYRRKLMRSTWLGLAFTRFRHLTGFQETNKCNSCFLTALWPTDSNSVYKQTFLAN